MGHLAPYWAQWLRSRSQYSCSVAGNTWAKRPSIATLICPQSRRAKANKPKLARSLPRRRPVAWPTRGGCPSAQPAVASLEQNETRGWARAPSRRNGREGEGGRAMLTRRGFAGLFAATALTSGGLAHSAAAREAKIQVNE